MVLDTDVFVAALRSRHNDRASRPCLANLEAVVTRSNYALRPQLSLKVEAERLAKAEGTTLNQFINVAVAEKVDALRTVDYFRERALRADVPAALTLLDQLGTDEPPQPGDKLTFG